MKIYPQLRLIWTALLISALALLVLPVENETVLFVSNLISLAAQGAVVFALNRIAGESQRLSRAFLYQLISLVLLVLSMVCAPLISSSEGMFPIFTSLLSLCGGLFGLIAEYHLFWGLDERVIPCGYRYPARRIRWCFYTPLLGGVVGTLLASVVLATQLGGVTTVEEAAALPLEPALWVVAAVQFVGQLIVLLLFRGYNRAVRDREEDPLESAA